MKRYLQEKSDYDKRNRADEIFDAIIENKKGQRFFFSVTMSKDGYVQHYLYDEEGEFISSSNEWNDKNDKGWIPYDPKRYLRSDILKEVQGMGYKFRGVFIDKYKVLKQEDTKRV